MVSAKYTHRYRAKATFSASSRRRQDGDSIRERSKIPYVVHTAATRQLDVAKVAAQSDGLAVGFRVSQRSNGVLDLRLRQCRQLLIRYGNHQMTVALE